MSTTIPAWRDGELSPVEKLEVHYKGLKHKAVSVFVLSGNKILLQRRALGKYHTPGLWANTCCTHPNWGESPMDCATRRLNEELGITGLTLLHRDCLEYRADVGGGMVEHEVVDVFLSHAPQDLTIECNPNEVIEVQWLAFDDLREALSANPDRFTPWLKIYIDQHSAAIFGSESELV